MHLHIFLTIKLSEHITQTKPYIKYFKIVEYITLEMQILQFSYKSNRELIACYADATKLHGCIKEMTEKSHHHIAKHRC